MKLSTQFSLEIFAAEKNVSNIYIYIYVRVTLYTYIRYVSKLYTGCPT